MTSKMKGKRRFDLKHRTLPSPCVTMHHLALVRPDRRAFLNPANPGSCCIPGPTQQRPCRVCALLGNHKILPAACTAS